MRPPSAGGGCSAHETQAKVDVAGGAVGAGLGASQSLKVLGPVQPAMLARAITLMSDPKRRQHYAAMARRRMDDYRINGITARYWKTFADVLDRRPVSAPQPGPPPAAGRETA